MGQGIILRGRLDMAKFETMGLSVSLFLSAFLTFVALPLS
jgi:hypothetical protein